MSNRLLCLGLAAVVWVFFPRAAQAQASRPAPPASFSPQPTAASAVFEPPAPDNLQWRLRAVRQRGFSSEGNDSGPLATDTGAVRARLARRFAQADSVGRHRSWTPVIIGAAFFGAAGAYAFHGLCRDPDGGNPHESCFLPTVEGAVLGGGAGSIAGAIIGTVSS